MRNTSLFDRSKCLLIFELLQSVVQVLAGIFAVIFIMHCLKGYEEMLIDYVFVGVLALLYFALEVCINFVDKDEQLNYWKLVDQKKLENKENNKNE